MQTQTMFPQVVTEIIKRLLKAGYVDAKDAYNISDMESGTHFVKDLKCGLASVRISLAGYSGFMMYFDLPVIQREGSTEINGNHKCQLMYNIDGNTLRRLPTYIERKIWKSSTQQV